MTGGGSIGGECDDGDDDGSIFVGVVAMVSLSIVSGILVVVVVVAVLVSNGGGGGESFIVVFLFL